MLRFIHNMSYTDEATEEILEEIRIQETIKEIKEDGFEEYIKPEFID